MKKNIMISLVVLITLMTVFVGCTKKEVKQVDSLKEIKSKGYFILGLDDSFPPMGFRGESGEIEGFDIDMAKEVANRMGVELKIQPIDWDAKILDLNNKNIDLIWNGLTITNERKEKIGFSQAYLKNRQIIIIRNNSNIKTKKDLSDKIVGVQMASSGEEAIAKDTIASDIAEVRKYSKYTEALLDLQAKRTDAVVMDEVVGRYYISKKPGEFKVADEDFGKEEYGIGFRKGDKEFKEEIDKILMEMKKDKTSKKIAQKWFGDESILK